MVLLANSDRRGDLRLRSPKPAPLPAFPTSGARAAGQAVPVVPVMPDGAPDRAPGTRGRPGSDRPGAPFV